MSDGTYIDIIKNLVITLPSVVYHGIINIIHKQPYKSYPKIAFNIVDSPNLILLIHGYNGNASNFIPLVDNLLLNYYMKLNYNIVGINLPKIPNNCPLTTIEFESQYVQSFLESSPKFTNVILIGLSKGGLICSHLLSLKHQLPQIKKIITISSPLLGTLSADKFLFDSCKVKKELCYQSSITKDLEMKLQKYGEFIYHIIPRYDYMLTPSNVCYYEFTPESNKFYYDGIKYSHVGITYSPDIIEPLFHWIFN